MGPMQLVVSGLLTLILYSVALFAVYRIFQIGTDVSEIKELLREIKRYAGETPQGATRPLRSAEPVPASAEALVRAVHESYVSEK